MLKKITIAAVLIIVLSCTTSDYDTFKYNPHNYQQSKVTVTENGLTKDQIESILNTTFPSAPPISISIIPSSIKGNEKYLGKLLPEIISSMQTIEWIDKIVPIPNELIMDNLSFTSIQEVGIRSLCQYSLVFIGDSSTYCSFKQFAKGEYEITSSIEFLLVDNQTTAIIAADKIFSSKITALDLFDSSKEEEAKIAIFKEQSKLLKEKLEELFGYGG